MNTVLKVFDQSIMKVIRFTTHRTLLNDSHEFTCHLTRVVAEGNSSVVVRQGTEVFGFDLNHGGPRERHVVLHEGLGHGLLHHQVDIRHLHRETGRPIRVRVRGG